MPQSTHVTARQPLANAPPATRRKRRTALLSSVLVAPALFGLVACSTTSSDGKSDTKVVITPFGFYSRTETRSDDDDNNGAQALAQALVVAVAIASKLEKVNQTCQSLSSAEYRIDCLGEGYTRTAADIPDNATFGDAREAVARAASQLSGLAAANRAPAALPDVKVPEAKRSVRPVSPEKLKAAQAAALEIIEETETVLLRSSDIKPSQSAAYEKIAAAVNSSKVLLRST
ncbi:hypothetical protein [Frigidibacter sp. ROC022]|uniref:hypothetical protein n=1 Tax=Frigidibacter sp. ROC022 TaxID=2971796 RepID=UPI00215A7181|nr:hypothetical protein [Frigidibacter sp. ROC022]MCR8723212.1 hypothetical protein [Frigidibacter sp. ROC022]